LTGEQSLPRFAHFFLLHRHLLFYLVKETNSRTHPQPGLIMVHPPLTPSVVTSALTAAFVNFFFLGTSALLLWHHQPPPFIPSFDPQIPRLIWWIPRFSPTLLSYVGTCPEPTPSRCHIFAKWLLQLPKSNVFSFFGENFSLPDPFSFFHFVSFA